MSDDLKTFLWVLFCMGASMLAISHRAETEARTDAETTCRHVLQRNFGKSADEARALIEAEHDHE